MGEFPLIGRVTARLASGAASRQAAAGVVLGPGDDAAVVLAPDGRVVVTTDLLVEGRHFRRDWSTGYDVGRKAAAQNLADVVAMGARPTALVVGFGAPAALPAAWVEELAAGLADEAARVGASVVGGDMTAADEVVVAVTALGDLEGRRPVTRSGARPGDTVCVVGRLGWAAAGLRLLQGPSLEGARRGPAGPLVAAHQRPDPPYAAGAALAAAGATAMIDVSDGLLADAGHIAAASHVGIALDLAALRALGAPGVGDEELLTGGDDHALLATMPPTGPAPGLATAMPAGCVVVGRVVTGSGVLVDGVPAGEVAGTGGHRHWD